MNTDTLNAVIVRLRAEEAENVSDAELERCLRPCVMGNKLVPYAKQLREAGFLTDEIVRDDYDPTPWCSWCGAKRRQDCDCGPIAEND